MVKGKMRSMVPHLLVMADGNYLRDVRLWMYLSAHTQHRIVLADLTLTEMFKTNALGTARASLQILADFPDQIFALKPTHLWLDAKVRSETDLQQLIDPARSDDLRQLSRDYKSEKAIHSLSDRMKPRESEASEYMRRLSDQVQALEGKGGSGKSTLCRALASAAAARGETVTIFDTDSSRSCLKWMQAGQAAGNWSPSTLGRQILRPPVFPQRVGEWSMSRFH